MIDDWKWLMTDCLTGHILGTSLGHLGDIWGTSGGHLCPILGISWEHADADALWPLVVTPGAAIVVTTGIKPRSQSALTSALVSAMCGREHWPWFIPFGKLTPAHSAGSPTVHGLWVCPAQWVSEFLTAAGPPTVRGTFYCPHPLPPTAQGQ